MKRRRRKTLPNGRNGEGGFIMLEIWILKTAAFRSLSTGARSLMLELLMRFNGHNNGKIRLGEREAAAALSIASRAAVRKYFGELEAKGFVVRTMHGGFNMKVPTSRRASEWRLTWLSCDGQGPSKEFARRQPEIPSIAG